MTPEINLKKPTNLPNYQLKHKLFYKAMPILNQVIMMRFTINELISHKEIPEKNTKFSLPELYNSKIQFHVLYWQSWITATMCTLYVQHLTVQCEITLSTPLWAHPAKRPCELLPSLGVHPSICNLLKKLFSETAWPNES